MESRKVKESQGESRRVEESQGEAYGVQIEESYERRV